MVGLKHLREGRLRLHSGAAFQRRSSGRCDQQAMREEKQSWPKPGNTVRKRNQPHTTSYEYTAAALGKENGDGIEIAVTFESVGDADSDCNG
jgi:hypothetical protein